MPKHMNIIRRQKGWLHVKYLSSHADTDEPIMFNSNDAFEDIQTALEEEMEYDGIVVDDLEPDACTGMQKLCANLST